MTPRRSFDDCANQRVGDSVFSCEIDPPRFAGRKGCADLSNVLLGQFCITISRPPWSQLRFRASTMSLRMTAHPIGVSNVHASLPLCIRHVIGVGSKEQVIRSDAWRIVAMVADKQPMRDWPIRQFPGVTVCGYSLPLRRIGVSVSTAIFPERPQPAISRCIDLRPEPFCRRRKLDRGWSVANWPVVQSPLPLRSPRSLRIHISDAVEMRSKPKMIGSNTCMALTDVENLQSFGDGANVENPRGAVCRDVTIQREHAVPDVVPSTHPQPTFTARIDPSPEPFFRGHEKAASVMTEMVADATRHGDGHKQASGVIGLVQSKRRQHIQYSRKAA